MNLQVGISYMGSRHCGIRTDTTPQLPMLQLKRPHDPKATLSASHACWKPPNQHTAQAPAERQHIMGRGDLNYRHFLLPETVRTRGTQNLVSSSSPRRAEAPGGAARSPAMAHQAATMQNPRTQTFKTLTRKLPLPQNPLLQAPRRLGHTRTTLSESLPEGLGERLRLRDLLKGFWGLFVCDPLKGRAGRLRAEKALKLKAVGRLRLHAASLARKKTEEKLKTRSSSKQPQPTKHKGCPKKARKGTPKKGPNKENPRKA